MPCIHVERQSLITDKRSLQKIDEIIPLPVTEFHKSNISLYIEKYQYFINPILYL